MKSRIHILSAFLTLMAVVPGSATAGRIISADSIPADSISGNGISADSVPADSIPTLPSRIVPKSTPVDIDREKPEGPILHYYDKHGNPLDTPVRFLSELDTVTTAKPGPKFPAFNGVSIGANFFDAIMMVVGQQRASFDISADCSIHNWFFPVIELGVGFSDAHPEDGRCNFKASPSFYAKVGINYNFLYKSNPDYQVFLGLRAGVTDFGYDIYSISPGSRYYTEKGPAEATGIHATCFYGQALAGLKVNIYKGFGLGWTVRYAFNIHQKFSDPSYPAWFIPGKGTGPLSATFSLYFSFGRKRGKLPEAVDAINTSE